MSFVKEASIGAVRSGCLCCPLKPEVAPLDWRPHPGFGLLDLTCDGERPEWWYEFCDWPTEDHYSQPAWITGDVLVGPRKGEPFGFWAGGWERWTLDELVTLSDIEDAVAEDPEHDWRLTVEGPLGGVVYQRQGCAQWVAVKRLVGFA